MGGAGRVGAETEREGVQRVREGGREGGRGEKRRGAGEREMEREREREREIGGRTR